MTDDPWSPLSLENYLNLASWLVPSTVAKSQINPFYAEGLEGTDSRSFRSAYNLRQHLDILNPFGEYLVLAGASIDDGRHGTTFYYRNIIECVHYLIPQVAYSTDMVYAPIRESDSRGE